MPPDTTAVKVMYAALIDLDATFLVQLAIFLALYVLLSWLFFKPYAARLRRRDETVKSLLRENREMQDRVKTLEERLSSEIAQARGRAMLERREMVEAAVAERDATLTAERKKTQDEVDQALSALEARKQALLASLDGEVGTLAGMIQQRWQEGRNADR